jgi:hypothetical protein
MLKKGLRRNSSNLTRLIIGEENKIEVGMLKDQFRLQEFKKYSKLKFHKVDKKRLPTTT